MKTLFFCNLIPNKLGAFEALLAELGGVFKAAGDELVCVFAREPIPEVAGELRGAGVRWHVMDAWTEGQNREHPWAFVRPALRLLQQERPDVAVVHFGNELPALCAAALHRMRGGRVTKWVWQQDQQIRDPAAMAQCFSRLRLLSLAFDRFVGVYDGGKDSLLKRGLRSGCVAVVYNAIRDYTPRRPKGWLRQELGRNPQSVVVANVGWLVPRKRIEFVLAALADMGKTAGRDVTLVQIGEGPERSRLEDVARELGIRERVMYLGLRSDVREILAECDVLAHASLAETCTYVITESMCAGIPAVVTEAGAAREQIIDGVTGYVTGKDDRELFSRRLASLVDDAGLRFRLGTAARQRWHERYRVEVSARKYHELYSQLARGDDRRP